MTLIYLTEGEGEGGGLGARGCAEAIKGDGEMGLYSVARDADLLRDFVVVESLCDEAQDVLLAA